MPAQGRAARLIVSSVVLILGATLAGPRLASAAPPQVEEGQDAAVGPRQIGDTRGAVGGFGSFAAAQGAGLGSGPAFGGSARFFFSRHVGVEGAVFHDSLDLARTSGNELSGGTLDTLSVGVGVVVRIPSTARVAPYASGGVVYFSPAFQLAPGIESALTELRFEPLEEVDSVVGFQVAGGLDALLAGPLGVFGEVRYVNGTADTTAGLRDVASGTAARLAGEQELHRVAVVAGLRVFF